MTYTKDHKRRLKALHKRDPNFGVIGHLWADRVAAFMRETESRTLLDYGCGRSNLARTVAQKLADEHYDILFTEYDPATKPGEPLPAEYVTCIDVMEHVERHMIEPVFLDLQRLMQKGGLITISLRRASPLRRAVHPTVRPRHWWLKRLQKYFVVTEIEPLDPTKAASELAVLVEPPT